MLSFLSTSSASTRALAVLTVVCVLVQAAYVLRASLALATSDVLAACVASGKGGKTPASAAAALTQSTCAAGVPCAVTRDCAAGAPGYCSFEKPCTPCPDVWSASDAGCVACSSSANNGDCGFVPGWGCVARRERAARAHAHTALTPTAPSHAAQPLLPLQ